MPAVPGLPTEQHIQQMIARYRYGRDNAYSTGAAASLFCSTREFLPSYLAASTTTAVNGLGSFLMDGEFTLICDLE